MQISAQRLFGQLRVIVSKEEATVRKEVWRGLVTNPVKIFGFLVTHRGDLRKPSLGYAQRGSEEAIAEVSVRRGGGQKGELLLSLCGGVCDL